MLTNVRAGVTSHTRRRPSGPAPPASRSPGGLPGTPHARTRRPGSGVLIRSLAACLTGPLPSGLTISLMPSQLEFCLVNVAKDRARAGGRKGWAGGFPANTVTAGPDAEVGRLQRPGSPWCHRPGPPPWRHHRLVVPGFEGFVHGFTQSPAFGGDPASRLCLRGSQWFGVTVVGAGRAAGGPDAPRWPCGADTRPVRAAVCRQSCKLLHVTSWAGRAHFTCPLFW